MSGEGAFDNVILGRLLLIVMLGVAISAVPVAAETQAHAPRIGLLTSGACPTKGNLPLFLEGLQERGYVVGQNLVLECRHTEKASDERFRQFAAELVRLNVELIFAVSSAAVRGIRPASRPSQSSRWTSRVIRSEAGSQRASAGRVAISPGYFWTPNR